MTATALLLLFVGACPPPPADAALLVVTSADPRLRAEAPAVEETIREALKDRTAFLPSTAAVQALTAEGGRAERAKAVVEAQIRMDRAFERFRELEDAAALTLVADVTARLSAVSQSPGAIELLAEAHLLAGAIFLARGRIDAAQARLRRALQLSPELRAPPARYAPRVRAQLAALRGDPGPSAQLSVRIAPALTGAQVFVDGRARGAAPLELLDVPAGRHLVRVSAPGRLSFHTTVQLKATRTLQITARLPVDPEVDQIGNVPRWLNAEEARRQTLALIGRRAEAETVIAAEIRIGNERGPDGASTRSLVFWMPDRPPQAATVSSDDIRARFDALLACDPGEEPLAVAPALVDWPTPKTATRPVPPAKPWWKEPWVWAAFAVIAIGTAGGLAAARQAEGPPDAVEITLVPRP